jgi:phage shock protein A
MEQAQIRERFARWIEDTKELFALLPALLDHGQQLTAKTDHAEQETERLRRELGELRKELDETRKQNEQFRADKDEAAQALAKVLETVQATNQVAQKLGMMRSPFARREAPAPAPAAQPAPHE